MEAIEDLVTSNHGVVFRRELQERGLSKARIRAQVEEGMWRPHGRSMLLHASAPPGVLLDSFIAARHHPELALTGVSAALLRPHPAWADMTFAGSRAMLISERSTRGPWLDVVHPGALYERDEASGLLIADHETALVDLLRFLPEADAAAVAGAANRTGLAEVEDLLPRVAGLRRRLGAEQLRRMVRAMSDGAESGPEIDLQHAVWRAGFRGWVANPKMVLDGAKYRPDIAFPTRRLALEYQGFSAHTGKQAFERDWVRHNTFTFAGWIVLYLTAGVLYDSARWEQFCERLGRLLESPFAAAGAQAAPQRR